MPSEAAKKKAAAKKAASAAKRGGPKQAYSNKEEPEASSDVHDGEVQEGTNSSSHTPLACSKVTLPASLSAKQRAILHELAEEAGFNHASKGLTPETRQLSIWQSESSDPDSTYIMPDPGGDIPDSELASILDSKLGISGGHKLGSTNGVKGFGKKVKQMTREEFVRSMLPLLDLEKSAEVEASTEAVASLKPETAQRKGRALLNLKCTDASAGLLGKTLLTLQPNRGDLLPPHKFTPHDVVALRPNKSDPGGGNPPLAQGVVYRLREASITVAVDDLPDEGLDAPLRIEKLANEVTYKRLKEALGALNRVTLTGPAEDLVAVMFGNQPPRFAKQAVQFTPINRFLDHSQKSAVSRALGAHDVMLLHGPPGTGKTTAVVEIILQEVKRGHKILATAASNIAVDNLVERIAKHKVKVVRLGHPARLLPQVLDCALDALVLKTDNSSLANDIRKEVKQLNGQLLKTRDRRERGEIRRELKRLSKEERQRQQLAVDDVIKDADVICTTLTGALSFQLKGVDFDLVVVDEAAQALECACWIPILKGRRCILAGDHLQLPPTVQSAEAEKKGLGVTLFERLASLLGSECTAMLTVQYRMNRMIMKWSSEELYDGKVGAHESVASHSLCDLSPITANSATEPVLILIDTSGWDMDEVKEEEGDSTYNEGEANVVLVHVNRLLEAGVPASEIGIITPYSAQVGVLKEMRAQKASLANVEISTVDGFQGREKEAIIISMVRSNDKGEVGFLADHRRMNVAVTRARRQCTVVCDSETVSHDPFLKRMVAYFEKHGEYLSAMEYA